jgi:SAM-dependent methyltransferase
MTRLDVIQQLIDARKATTYLEIGVESGDVFIKARANKKIAVDPEIRITRKDKLKAIFRDFSNLSNEYYEMTSDEFFETRPDVLKNGFGVVFVDGLHTFEQSLKDVENSLKVLRQNGVVVVHDCNPTTEAAAHPALSWKDAASLGLRGWTGAWSGDVWKTIVYLRSTRKDLNVFVLDCDCGIGIITEGTPTSTLDHSKEEIDALSYGDLKKNRAELLNLKSSDYLREFIRSHQEG